MSPTQRTPTETLTAEVDDTLTITINLTDLPDAATDGRTLPSFSTSDTDDPTSVLIAHLGQRRPFPTALPSITELRSSVSGCKKRLAGPIYEFDSDGSTTETTITGLASNTSYDAQVRAVNAEGSRPLVADSQRQDG